jgi:hypothetical protein
MKTWWNETYCVRFLKTFLAMPWQYRFLDLSVFLASISMTLSCSLEPAKGLVSVAYRVLAGLYWLICMMYVANFVRGWLALRRGVPPAPPRKEPQVQLEKWGTIGTGLILGLMVASVGILAAKHGPDLSAWATVFFIAALFFSSLSSYARSRFWDLGFK